VTAALLCEKVLQEKDEALTIMRIADKLQYKLQGIGTSLPEGIKPIVSIEGVVSLKSGPVVGDHTIKVILERPNGDRKDVFTYPATFLGKDHGQNIILRMGLGIEMDGLYWFDILFDEELLTRIPLMVTPAPESAPQEQT